MTDLPAKFSHGGRRPRAGRPPDLAKQLAEARELATQLRVAVRSGLMRLAENYEALLDIAITKASEGDTKVLLHLLDLPGKMGITINETEEGSRPADGVTAAFRLRLDAIIENHDDETLTIVEG